MAITIEISFEFPNTIYFTWENKNSHSWERKKPQKNALQRFYILLSLIALWDSLGLAAKYTNIDFASTLENSIVLHCYHW